MLLSVEAGAFTLSVESLSKKQDHFSTLKKRIEYKELDSLIKTCESSAKKSCLEKAQLTYVDPQFIFFRPLIVNLSVNAVVKSLRPIETLSFLNKDEFTDNELKLLLRSYSFNTIVSFFTEDFILGSPDFRKTLINNVSLICKFSDMPEYSTSILEEVAVQDDFYNKNYSKFPCGLNLTGRWLELLEEISAFKKKYAQDYKFSFLQKKALKKSYRSFPKYKKRSLEYKKKHMWKSILKVRGSLQVKVIRNLFYRGQYELLSHASKIEITEIKKMPSKALQYIVKSLVATGDYDKALLVSEGIRMSDDQSTEEILLMRAGIFLRKKEWSEAAKHYRMILENPVDLRLSALYWLRVALKKQGKKKELKKVDEDILNLYPFSYYGILVGKERQGREFFKSYKEKRIVEQDFSNVLSSGDIERLNFFYSYEHKRRFKQTFKKIEKKINPFQRALFSYVFKNTGDQLEVIRSLNLIWDDSNEVRKEPFVSLSFPSPYDEEVKKALEKTNHSDMSLVYAVIRQESAFGVRAKSPSGARGLMQLLPSTARDVSRQIRARKYRSARDLYKPEMNIYLGTRYMDRLIGAGKGYLPYAFSSYNAGPGRMYKWSKYRSEITDLRLGKPKKEFDPIDELWIEELPWSETRFYTKALLRNMGIYRSLKSQQEKTNCNPFWACK